MVYRLACCSSLRRSVLVFARRSDGLSEAVGSASVDLFVTSTEYPTLLWNDGDGRADKFTVFAEGFNIPSGIAVGHGGVWVRSVAISNGRNGSRCLTLAFSTSSDSLWMVRRSLWPTSTYLHPSLLRNCPEMSPV